MAREVAGHFWSISKKASQLHGKNEVGGRYGAAAATNEYAIGRGWKLRAFAIETAGRTFTEPD